MGVRPTVTTQTQTNPPAPPILAKTFFPRIFPKMAILGGFPKKNSEKFSILYGKIVIFLCKNL